MKRKIGQIVFSVFLILCIVFTSIISVAASNTPQISYEFSTLLPGRADGTITISVDGYSGEKYLLCWGTSDGILEGYKVLADSSDMSISGETLKFKPEPLTCIPPEATHLWLTLNGERITSYEIPEARRLEKSECQYSFGVYSDAHFGSGNAIPSFQAAMDFFSEKDAQFVISVGDNTVSGEKNHWKEFADTYAPYSEIPLWFVLGNHDALAWNLSVTPAQSLTNARSYFPNYAKELHSYGAEFKVTVSGNNWNYDYSMTYGRDLYLFMGIGAASNSSDDQNIDQRLSGEQLEWLRECLSEHYKQSEPGKVFLIFHYYTLESGMYRDSGTEWDESSSKELHTLLNKYPGVIYFSGHTHYSFDADLTSYAGSYAALHVPSLSQSRTLNGKGHTGGYEGYLVEVYDGYTLVKGMDFLKEEVVSNSLFVISEEFSDNVATYGIVLRSTASGVVQWKAKKGGSGWTKLTTLSELKIDGTVQSLVYSGEKTVDFRANETHMQWKCSEEDDSAWVDLISLEKIPKEDLESDNSDFAGTQSKTENNSSDFAGTQSNTENNSSDFAGTGDNEGRNGAMIWVAVGIAAAILCCGAVAFVLILRKNRK